MRLAYTLVVPVLIVPTLAVAPVAGADCTSSGATTICSQGDVRGSNTGTGPSTGGGPYVPYPCEWGYYACDDVWNVDFDVDLDPGRPGRPDIGGPGGPDFGGGGGRGGRGGGRR